MLTAEQLTLRRTGISSTDIAAICGLNPYTSAYAVWADKLGKGAPREETEAMYWGIKLEPVILQRYATELLDEGLFVEPWQETVGHPDDPLLLCTPDGRVRQCLFGRIVRGVEVKTAASYEQVQRWGDAKDAVPEEYLVQCQWCMLVTGLPRWDVVVLLAGYHGLECRIYQLEANPDLQAKLRTIAQDFWDRYVVPHVQPPVDGSRATREALLAMWPEHRTPAVEATGEQDDLAVELLEAETQRKAAQKAEELVRQQLMASMGESEKVKGADWSATWKADKRGRRIFRPWFKK